MPISGSEAARIVLDTSAYSKLMRGHSEILDRLAAAEVILIPVTVLGELRAGFEIGARTRENARTLREFLDEPFVAVLETTTAIARRYGLVFASLRRNGTPIPVNDIWIAATALDCGGHLLTFDQHFEQVEGLDCTVFPLEG